MTTYYEVKISAENQRQETFLEHPQRDGFKEIAWHHMNEREWYGRDKRDLDWLYSFARKV